MAAASAARVNERISTLLKVLGQEGNARRGGKVSPGEQPAGATARVRPQPRTSRTAARAISPGVRATGKRRRGSGTPGARRAWLKRVSIRVSWVLSKKFIGIPVVGSERRLRR